MAADPGPLEELLQTKDDYINEMNNLYLEDFPLHVTNLPKDGLEEVL